MPEAKIVGVEQSAEVVRAARRWFDLDALGIEVVRDDAQRYLAKSRRTFDAVIEDCFTGSAGSERKPQWILEAGLSSMAKRLRPGGLLITNSIDETAEAARALRGDFRAVVQISIRGYDNRILVGGPRGLDGRGLRAATGAHAALADARGQLCFRSLSNR